jgi:hypothetical protein
MKTITVKLPDALAAWLSAQALRRGRPKSEVVREALERASAATAGAACIDAFADVCGVIEGPKDLSTNRKHMSGFGE